MQDIETLFSYIMMLIGGMFSSAFMLIMMIVPMFFLTRYFLNGAAFAILMIVVLMIIAFLFVYNFNMFKLHGKKLIPVGIIGLLMVCILVLQVVHLSPILFHAVPSQHV